MLGGEGSLSACRGDLGGGDPGELMHAVLGGRRELRGARTSIERIVVATNPVIPSRRSARKCVVKNPPVGVHNNMAAEEESDETKTEDDYIPGKSPNPALPPTFFCLDANLILVGGCLYAKHVSYM